MRTEDDSALGTYLKRLADELEALPPADVRDIVAEVRSYVAEAAAEHGDSVARVLERYGEPAILATGILADRGLLPGPREIPEAGAPRRVLAGVIDFLVAAAALVMAVPFVYFLVEQGSWTGSSLWLAAAGKATAGIAWAWFYWANSRATGRTWSAGMLLAGIRHVRAPKGRRVVAARDAHGPRPGIWSYAATLVGLVVVGAVYVTYVPVILSLPVRYEITQIGGTPIQAAETDRQAAVSTVSLLLHELCADAPTDAPAEFVSGAAAETLAELVPRVRSAGLRSYQMYDAGVWEYAAPGEPGATTDATATLVVSLDGGTVPASAPAWLRLTVTKRVTDIQLDGGSGSWATEYKIADIADGSEYSGAPSSDALFPRGP